MTYSPGAKVKIGNETIIDLTGDTVTAADLRRGVTAHSKSGQQIVGAYVDKFYGYGTCNAVNNVTGECTVVASGFQLAAGVAIAIAFSVDVPISATLNINSTGAEALTYSGAAITDGVIKSGDTATVIYNGTSYVLMAIDHWAVRSNAGRGFAYLEFNTYEYEYEGGDPEIAHFDGPVDYELVDGGLVYANFPYSGWRDNTKISVNNGPAKRVIVFDADLQDYSNTLEGDIYAEGALLEYWADHDAYLLIAKSSLIRKDDRPTTKVQLYGVTIGTSGSGPGAKRYINLYDNGFALSSGNTIIIFNIQTAVELGASLYVSFDSGSHTYDLKQANGSGGYVNVTSLSVGLHTIAYAGSMFVLVN